MLLRSTLVLPFVILMIGCSSADAEDASRNDDQSARKKSKDDDEPVSASDESDASTGSTPASNDNTPAQPAPTAPSGDAPPAGAGFTLEQGNVLKSATGVCAQGGTDNALRTATCSGDASQKFAIYAMPDKAYELCLPKTLKLASATAEEYHATCLSRAGDTGLQFSETVLSKKVGNAFQGQSGHILAENGGILGWKDSSRKLTKDSEGVVVLGKHSGNPDQQWSLTM